MKGSHSTLGQHRGLPCTGCGTIVRLKDPFLWLQGSGHSTRAWHFDCKVKSLKLGNVP